MVKSQRVALDARVPSIVQIKYLGVTKVRDILVSVKFLSAILGPEMAAPIFMDAWKNASVLQENHVHKIPRFRVGGYFGFWGGGSADFIFMGARIFLRKVFSNEIPQIICVILGF